MKGNYEKTILAEDDPCPENVETTKSETEAALEDRARAMVLGFGIMLFYAPMLCKISKSRDIMQLYMKGRLNHEAITAKKRYGQRCGKSVDGGIDTVKVSEIDEKVAQLLGIPADVLEIEDTNCTGSEFGYQMRWIRTDLKKRDN